MRRRVRVMDIAERLEARSFAEVAGLKACAIVLTDVRRITLSDVKR